MKTLEDYEWNLLQSQLLVLQCDLILARSYARILAHSYVHDSTPPQDIVEASLAFPLNGKVEE